MQILGVDYGRKKIGLARGDSETKFAEPLMVIGYENLNKAVEKVAQVVQVEQVHKVIVGVSEGEMGKEAKDFGTSLSKSINLPVETFDETLTTREAQRLSIEAGIKRKKRKNLEDAYAAALMLQNFLEKN